MILSQHVLLIPYEFTLNMQSSKVLHAGKDLCRHSTEERDGDKTRQKFHIRTNCSPNGVLTVPADQRAAFGTTVLSLFFLVSA
jgi:hypothetical protein